MKAAPFDYVRADDLDHACALLAADDGARLIAGGQTLVPMMTMRLARPTKLIDIGRIAALSFIREENDGIAIGATTRQCLVERDPRVAARLPLLAAAMPWIGQAATRARGTIGGSLANADPAAELSLIAVTLDATLHYRAGGKTARIPASAFFLGAMTTALPAGACLTAVHFPAWSGRTGSAFEEVSVRRGDFALACAAAQVELADDGSLKRLAIGIGGATECPLRLTQVEARLIGTTANEAVIKNALDEALAGIEPLADLHASAAYRRRAAAKLAARSIADALTTAQRGPARAH